MSPNDTLPSCNNDAPPEPVGAENIDSMPLGKVLVSTIGQSQKSEDDYILYDAASDSFLTMTASEYALAQAFATVVVKSGKGPKRVPEGLGWINAGSGMNELDALRIARKIAKELHKGKDFEVCCEYAADGVTFTIYYRPVPKVPPKA